MALPLTQGDSMRAHDKAVYDWIGTLLVDYGTIVGTARNAFPILRVFASPERAFATVTDVLVALGWMDGATAADMRTKGDAEWPNLPLPVATIQRDEPRPDPELSNVPGQFRRLYLNPVTGKWEYHRWPGHFVTTYKVTFRVSKHYTENFIREWIYAQVGALGQSHTELLIPVTHPAPWGVQKQKLRLDGSVDLSALEGAEGRMLVYEFSFTLRTWIFYPAVVGGDVTHGTGVDSGLLTLAFGDTDNTTGTEPDGGVSAMMSNNLFYFPVLPSQIATTWPKSGGALALPGERSPGGSASTRDHQSLRAKVTTAVVDSVELLERLCRRDDSGRTIISVSLTYSSSGAAATLEVDQHDTVGGTISMANQLSLPVRREWTRVHYFTIVREEAFIVALVGAGAAADVTVAEVDIRQVYDGTRVASQATTVDGSDRVDQWGSLDNQPYLVVGVLTAAVGVAAATVTAKNDISSPDYTQTQSIDPDVNVGFVFLVQPKDGTIELRTPTTLALDTVYVQRYDGPYNGHNL